MLDCLSVCLAKHKFYMGYNPKTPSKLYKSSVWEMHPQMRTLQRFVVSGCIHCMLVCSLHIMVLYPAAAMRGYRVRRRVLLG